MERQDRIPVTLWLTVAVALGIFGAIISIGYAFDLKWVGVVDYKDTTYKTLWDWLTVLIVPIVLGVGGYLFTRSENRRTQEIANQQRTVELRIAESNRQDDTLRAYLDRISQLITDKERPLNRAQLGDSLSSVARAQTLTVLPRLDGERKGVVLRFLYEAGLITRDHAVLDLSDADLKGAHLEWARLSRAALSYVDLSSAKLEWAKLDGADLRLAHLSGARLGSADLSGADLGNDFARWHPMNGPLLMNGAFLNGARLRFANLSDARLNSASLKGAYLGGANLSGAYGYTEEQLVEAQELRGATMPNGQGYHEWLEDRDNLREDEGTPSPI